MVVLDFLLQANAKKTTKPILLDSLHITAAIYSESSNIGLVVLDCLHANAMPTKPILLDSLHITAAIYSESSNISKKNGGFF